MKQILMKNSISASTSTNCIALDSDLVGSVFEIKWNKRSSPLILTESKHEKNDNAQTMISNFLSTKLTDIKDKALFYISGYVVKQMLKVISCSNCANMLIRNIGEHNYAHSDYYIVFLDTISNGGLISVSDSVFKITLEAENLFIILTNNTRNLQRVNMDVIINEISNKFTLDGRVIFNHYDCNFLELAFEAPHKVQLIKSVAKAYLKLRFVWFGKFYTTDIMNPISKRQQLNKLILFNSD